MRTVKGLSFVGMLFTMAAVMILGILALRVAPVYIQHYAVVRALHSLALTPNQAPSLEPSANELAIRRTLMKQFEIDHIEDINENNITLTAGQSENLIVVTIQYQVTRPFLGNIDLLFKFNNAQEVSIGRE